MDNNLNLLLAIELENFFSIKEKIRLDFRAGTLNTAQAKLLKDNVIEWNGQKILKTIGLFGPNAAGKSNIIKAINFCCRMVIDSHLHNQGVTFNFQPFKFDGWAEKPSTFYIDFVYDNIEYEYTYTLTRNEILKESLYFYPNNRLSKIFEREGDQYTFGTRIFDHPQEVVRATNPKQLFLSVASWMNREAAKEVYLYFLQTFLLGLVNMKDASVETLFNQEKDIIMAALSVCDSDIIDIALMHEKIMAPVPVRGDGEHLDLEIKPTDSIRFKTYHKVDPNIPFDFDQEESDGTKRLFAILLRLIDVARNHKSMMIDEFDTSLHHLLSKFIIDMFHASECSQLLFTSHNVNLIDMDIFRRDQIVFVDKCTNGATRVYSLYDFKDFRDTMDARKGYLQGRFDAIPYVTSSVSMIKRILEKGRE